MDRVQHLHQHQHTGHLPGQQQQHQLRQLPGRREPQRAAGRPHHDEEILLAADEIKVEPEQLELAYPMGQPSTDELEAIRASRASRCGQDSQKRERGGGGGDKGGRRKGLDSKDDTDDFVEDRRRRRPKGSIQAALDAVEESERELAEAKRLHKAGTGAPRKDLQHASTSLAPKPSSASHAPKPSSGTHDRGGTKAPPPAGNKKTNPNPEPQKPTKAKQGKKVRLERKFQSVDLSEDEEEELLEVLRNADLCKSATRTANSCRQIIDKVTELSGFYRNPNVDAASPGSPVRKNCAEKMTNILRIMHREKYLPVPTADLDS